MKRLYLFLLTFAFIGLMSSCTLWEYGQKSKKPREASRWSSSFTKIMKSHDNEYRYAMAEQYYVKKKYEYARTLFEDLFSYLKGTSRYEDAYYKVAYSYYYSKDYLNAAEYFKTFSENFQGSVRAEECEFMRAYTYYLQSPRVDLDQTNTTKAIGLMQAFVNTHPSSPRNKEANSIIEECKNKLEQKDYNSAKLYLDLGYYKAATVTYNVLIDNYPDTKRGDLYKFELIKAYSLYADKSITDKAIERYNKVISESTDFLERFTSSPYIVEVKKYQNDAIEKVKKITNEQIKTAS